MLELVQKPIRQRDMADLEQQLVTLLRLDYTTPEQLEALFTYLLQVGDTANPERFICQLAQRLPQHEEILMTIAQKLEEKARQEGILLGEQKGRQDGILLGEQKGRQEGILLGEQKGRQEGLLLGEQKGRQEGILLGEQKGRQEGILLGEQKGR